MSKICYEKKKTFELQNENTKFRNQPFLFQYSPLFQWLLAFHGISSDFFLFDMQICSRILENKREGALLPHISSKGQWFKYVIQYLRTTWNVHRSTILLKIVLHCKFAEQLAYETLLDDCFFVKCINFSYV